jgi:hypothetical protein
MPQAIQAGTLFLNYQQELQIQLSAVSGAQGVQAASPVAGTMAPVIAANTVQITQQAQPAMLTQAPLVAQPVNVVQQPGAVVPFQASAGRGSLAMAPAALGLPVNSLPTIGSALRTADLPTVQGAVPQQTQEQLFLPPQDFLPVESLSTGTSSASDATNQPTNNSDFSNPQNEGMMDTVVNLLASALMMVLKNLASTSS